MASDIPRTWLFGDKRKVKAPRWPRQRQNFAYTAHSDSSANDQLDRHNQASMPPNPGCPLSLQRQAARMSVILLTRSNDHRWRILFVELEVRPKVICRQGWSSLVRRSRRAASKANCRFPCCGWQGAGCAGQFASLQDESTSTTRPVLRPLAISTLSCTRTMNRPSF